MKKLDRFIWSIYTNDQSNSEASLNLVEYLRWSFFAKPDNGF